jgi:hypothetical protein
MHRAITENPAYIEMLANLGEVAEDLITPPITDREMTEWQAEPIGLASMETILKARGNAFWVSEENKARALDGLDLEREIIDARYFDTFGGDSLTHTLIKEGLLKDLTDAGMPDAIRSTGSVLAYLEDRPVLKNSYVRFLPAWPRAIAYHGALRIITNRLRSDKAHLGAALVLGDDTQHELLVRVNKRPYDTPAKRAALETFVEGYDSVAFAGAHVELGGGEHMQDRTRFARAVLGYTAIVPGSGVLAPMALRGEYFRDFTDEDGNIVPEYAQAFAARSKRMAESGKRQPFIEEPEERPAPQPPYDPEYCNAMGLPMRPKIEYIPEYEGEGCPARFQRIVHTSAFLFADKVAELSGDGVAAPTPKILNLAPIIEAGEKARAHLR